MEETDEVVVVETKMDKDATDQNIGKLSAAKSHYQKLNELLADEGSTRRYSFHFLSPVDYDSSSPRRGRATNQASLRRSRRS
jgi:type III restriction enzyme